MIKINSRTSSPYKLQHVRNPYVSQFDISSCHTQEQITNSLYSPLDDVEAHNIYQKLKDSPYSAHRTRRKIVCNNQSFEIDCKNHPNKFSSEADLTHTIIPQIKKEELRSPPLLQPTKVPSRKFVLKKIDLQKITNNNNNNILQQIDVRNQRTTEKTSISPKPNQFSLGFDDRLMIRSSINALRNTHKVKKMYDSQQTTDDYSDEIECAENILQQIKNHESLESQTVIYPSQKIKSVRVSDDVPEVSDDESEEEYNIWPNNSEVLMRGIDFENFTDNQHQPLLPQVIYKVRTVFYNQFQSINSDVTKQTKQNKSSSLSQGNCRDILEYIPNDKKIQADFQTLREFASIVKKRKIKNQERIPSPKKFKNHFVVQLEREKFFQNIQIYQSASATPQFIVFQQYFNKYRKTEQMKLRPLRFQRYPITTLHHIETQQSISKRIKSSSSNQETPRKHSNIFKNKQRNASNFAQYVHIENQNQSPLLPQDLQESYSNRKRCTSNLKNRNINMMNSSNNSVHLYKYMKQGNGNTSVAAAASEILQYQPKSKKKSFNSILDEIVIKSKI